MQVFRMIFCRGCGLRPRHDRSGLMLSVLFLNLLARRFASADKTNMPWQVGGVGMSHAIRGRRSSCKTSTETGMPFGGPTRFMVLWSQFTEQPPLPS